MTNTDSFIEEVTEEVRRDRLYALMRRYGWIAVAIVLILVGGAAYNEWRVATEQAAAQAAGDALYAAADAGDAEAQARAYAALDLPGAAGAVQRMMEAGSLAEAGQIDEAAATFAGLAADASQPQVWRDLAALKRIILLGARSPAEDRLAALGPLTAPGAPFRVLAVEQQALAQVDAGRRDEAITLLKSLLSDQEASLGLRLRAAQLMVALGGRPEAG